MHGNIHNGAGLAAFLLILVAMLTASYRFRREANWRSHATTTTALATAGIVTFFLIPTLGNSHFGLAQRLFVGTFVAWILTTAAYARNVSRAHDGARAPMPNTQRAIRGRIHVPNSGHAAGTTPKSVGNSKR
jgi:hypothetical protein